MIQIDEIVHLKSGCFSRSINFFFGEKKSNHSNLIPMKSSEISQTDKDLYEYCVGSDVFLAQTVEQSA